MVELEPNAALKALNPASVMPRSVIVCHQSTKAETSLNAYRTNLMMRPTDNIHSVVISNTENTTPINTYPHMQRHVGSHTKSSYLRSSVTVVMDELEPKAALNILKQVSLA